MLSYYSSYSTYNFSARKNMILVWLKIYNFLGPDSLNKKQAVEITSAVRKLMRAELPIKLTYTYRECPDPFPELDGSANRPLKYNKTFKWISQFQKNPEEINLGILPPVHDNRNKWTTGGSSGVGMMYKPNATSLVSCWYGNKNMAITAIEHELGHILGAHHTSTEDVMNTNATGIAKFPLHFSDVSKQEIRSYLKV